MQNNPAKILVWDLETSPITSYTWATREQNVALNQIKEDWSVLAWSAKWYGDPASKTMYMDNSKAKNIRDDKALIVGLAKLLNQADIVITQNGDKFDIKKFNARAVIHGLPPVRHYRSTDTLKESRKVFSFTSHKLEYMSEKLNKKYKKLKHSEYPGFELWKAILEGDKRAWKVMKKYCIHDVLATEELYRTIQGWIKTQNLACYFDDADLRCVCGSTHLTKRGFVYTDSGKYQGYRCEDCLKRPHGKTNLLSTEKKRNLLKEGR